MRSECPFVCFTVLLENVRIVFPVETIHIYLQDSHRGPLYQYFLWNLHRRKLGYASTASEMALTLEELFWFQKHKEFLVVPKCSQGEDRCQKELVATWLFNKMCKILWKKKQNIGILCPVYSWMGFCVVQKFSALRIIMVELSQYFCCKMRLDFQGRCLGDFIKVQKNTE